MTQASSSAQKQPRKATPTQNASPMTTISKSNIKILNGGNAVNNSGSLTSRITGTLR